MPVARWSKALGIKCGEVQLSLARESPEGNVVGWEMLAEGASVAGGNAVTIND